MMDTLSSPSFSNQEASEQDDTSNVQKEEAQQEEEEIQEKQQEEGKEKEEEANMELAPAAVNLTFKVLTHNMWCHYLTTAPNKVHRMHNFMKDVGSHDYDVILLQELFIINVLGMVAGEELRNYMTTEFTKLGYEYQAISTPPPWFFGQTSGLLIFSKHPISTFEERRWYRIDDFGTGKGYMHALIQIHGQNVHIFNVHLDAHGAPARKDQLKALVEVLPKPYSTSHVIIAGDYNIDYNNTEEYNSMMELFTPREFRDVFADNIAPTHLTGKVIDHIYFYLFSFFLFFPLFFFLISSFPLFPIFILLSSSVNFDCHVDILATHSLRAKDQKVEKFVDSNGQAISDHYGLSAVFHF